MFGIAKPCRHHLSPELHREWVGHQCGLCLTLREHHGQAARATVNTDAIVLSVLTSAQRIHGVATVVASPCPLRAMLPATVVAPGDTAAVHAAAVSLTMAATKLADHAADRDGWAGRAPGLSGGLADRWLGQGADSGALVGFDAEVIGRSVARSNARERQAGLRVDDYVEPTEAAAAAAFRHTAVLAGRPRNLDALATIGAQYGRLIYLFDAIDDEDDDRAAGRFNALVACFPSPRERDRQADELVATAHRRLVAAFDELELCRDELARALLVDQLGRAARRRRRIAPQPSPHQHDRLGLDAEHAPSCRHDGPSAAARGAAPRRAPVRRQLQAAAQLGGAALGAVAVSLAIFRPGEGEGGEVPFDPNQPPYGQQPPAVPPPGPGGYGEQAASSGFEEAADVASDAACALCDCCDCCDCGDCCDCCDC
jgi:hypothetical protein